MKLNPFALAAAGINSKHPLDYNIAIPLLPTPFFETIVTQITAGKMSYYHGGTIRSGGEPLTTTQTVSAEQTGLMSWIKECDAVAVLALMQDTGGVEAEQIYIPPGAYLPVSYLVEVSDWEGGVLTPDVQQSVILSVAREVGALEERLRRLPPDRFNIALNALEFGSPLRIAADQAKLRVVVADGQGWVSEEDVRALLEPNDDIDDITSGFWVPKSARDHRIAIERKLAALRSQWPEVFECHVPIGPNLTKKIA